MFHSEEVIIHWRERERRRERKRKREKVFHSLTCSKTLINANDVSFICSRALWYLFLCTLSYNKWLLLCASLHLIRCISRMLGLCVIYYILLSVMKQTWESYSLTVTSFHYYTLHNILRRKKGVNLFDISTGCTFLCNIVLGSLTRIFRERWQQLRIWHYEEILVLLRREFMTDVRWMIWWFWN